MPLKLKGLATLKNMNVRKEGDQDDKILANDLTLHFGEIEAKHLSALVADEDDIVRAFWDDNGAPRFLAIGGIDFPGTQFRDHTLKLGGHEFQGVTLKKFKAACRDHHKASLSCQVQIHPQSHQGAQLMEFVGEEIRVEVLASPDLFDENPAEAAGDAV